jgi:hypothetical protein
VTSPERGGQPVASPGWTRQTALTPETPACTTTRATDGEIAFAAEDRDRGWYFGAFAQRRRGTPAGWIFSMTQRAWLDPERRADYGKLLVACAQGRDFAIISPGRDRRPGTADDLSTPEPVNPRPPRFEARPE